MTRCEISLTGEDFAGIKARAVEIQMQMQNDGWVWLSSRGFPKEKKVVLTMGKNDE